VADAVGEEGQAGRRPLRREKSQAAMKKNPWGSDFRVLRDAQKGRTGGEGEKGDAFHLVMVEGEPGRPVTPREHAVPPRRKTSGKQLGTRLLGGDKPLEHRFKAGDGFGGKCKSGERRGNLFRLTREDESSEGGSPRALRAERGFQGTKGLTPPRG
jgi:hypothetical protein